MIDNMSDAIAHYDDLLDCDGNVTVAGMTYQPSRILREIDPTAYRTGFHDYMDSLYQDGEAEDIDEWFEGGYLP